MRITFLDKHLSNNTKCLALRYRTSTDRGTYIYGWYNEKTSFSWSKTISPTMKANEEVATRRVEVKCDKTTSA